MSEQQSQCNCNNYAKRNTEDQIRDVVKTTIQDQINNAAEEANATQHPVSIITTITPEKPNGTTTEQLFLASVSVPQVGVRRSSADDGKLLFMEHNVAETAHPLAKIMREVLSRHHVTHAEFDEKHRYFAESAGFLNAQINYNRNNIKKALYRDKVSFSMFQQIIQTIMGFGLHDLIFELIEPKTGKIEKYSLVDIVTKGTMLEPPTIDTTIVDVTDQGKLPEGHLKE